MQAVGAREGHVAVFTDTSLENEEEDKANTVKNPEPAARRTTPFLTKFEKAKVLGARAFQLSCNAKPWIDADGETDNFKIATRELAEGKLRMIVRRYLPDGTYEDWPVTKLKPTFEREEQLEKMFRQ